MATYRGISLWDISEEGAAMCMKAAENHLELLQLCAEKTGCKFEILERGGLPVFLSRLCKKQAFAAGLLCFAAGLLLLSSFVWVVRIEGNERLPEGELLAACEKMGLHAGAWKRSVDTRAVTEGLLEGFADIAWVSVGIRGTDATVRLSETIERVEMPEQDTPYDIVAAADGVILQITAERGTPVALAGDVVKKGDVLISSALTIGLEGEEQHTEYTAAEGTVIARVWQWLTEEVPLQYEETIYSGVEKENDSLIFSGQELDLLHPDGQMKWEKELLFERAFRLGDFKLPLVWRRERWRAYETVTRERSVEAAKTILEEKIGEAAKKGLSPQDKIESITIQYESRADCVRANAELTMVKRIEEKSRMKEEKEQENTDEL